MRLFLTFTGREVLVCRGGLRRGGEAARRRAENERLDEEFPARLYDLQLQKFRQTSDVHAAEEKIQASTRRRVLRGAELAYGQAIAFTQARKTIRQVKDKPEGLNTAAAKFQRKMLSQADIPFGGWYLNDHHAASRRSDFDSTKP